MNIPERYRKAIDEFVDKAMERYGDRIESIILFGSVVRGEADRDSDIDVLVVVKKEDYRLRRALIGIAFDIMLQTGENVSVKVLSKNDLEGHKSCMMNERSRCSLTEQERDWMLLIVCSRKVFMRML